MGSQESRGHAVRLGIVVIVAVVAGAAGLALSSRSGDGAPARAVGQDGAIDATEAVGPEPAWPAPEPGEDLRRWGHPALVPGATPEGKEPIIFDDGGFPGLAGYVEAEGPNGWDRPSPVLDLGSGRHEARGVEVTDAEGVLLGYDVSGIGLVDLPTARDVGAMDALLDAAARRPTPPPMTPDEAARLFGLDVDEGTSGG